MMKGKDFSLECLDLLCREFWLLLCSFSSPVNLELFVKHYAFKERSEASFIPHDSALLSLNFLLASIIVCVCVYFLKRGRDESESPHVRILGCCAFILLSSLCAR